MSHPPVPPPFLTEQAYRAIVAQVRQATNGVGYTKVMASGSWWSDVRWARNRVSLVSESRKPSIVIRRYSASDESGNIGTANTNQTDPVSLTTASVWAEEMWQGVAPAVHGKHAEYPFPQVTYPKTRWWSEATYAMTADERCAIANDLLAGAEKAGMLAAGELLISANAGLVVLKGDRMQYAAQTWADCSITVRDPNGTGSGWAGATSWEWSRVHAQALADVALDKCLRSRNPVRIEPGRYTLIMEPQATGDLMRYLLGYMKLADASTPAHPFFDHMESGPPVSQWGPPVPVPITKIGQRVLDPRITITYEPDDPDLATWPFDVITGDFYQPVTWVKDGILTTLAYDAFLGPPGNRDPKGKPQSGAFRMSGGTTTIDEMIATTQRGLLTTRFSNMGPIPNTVLVSGITRDGLWLIENGKIKHPVTNLRFLESPFFAFNQVQQLGVSVPIYAPGQLTPPPQPGYTPGTPAIAPPVKVSDFNFVSLVDAV